MSDYSETNLRSYAPRVHPTATHETIGIALGSVSGVTTGFHLDAVAQLLNVPAAVGISVATAAALTATVKVAQYTMNGLAYQKFQKEVSPFVRQLQELTSTDGDNFKAGFAAASQGIATTFGTAFLAYSATGMTSVSGGLGLLTAAATGVFSYKAVETGAAYDRVQKQSNVINAPTFFA